MLIRSMLITNVILRKYVYCLDNLSWASTRAYLLFFRDKLIQIKIKNNVSDFCDTI